MFCLVFKVHFIAVSDFLILPFRNIACQHFLKIIFQFVESVFVVVEDK